MPISERVDWESSCYNKHLGVNLGKSMDEMQQDAIQEVLTSVNHCVINKQLQLPVTITLALDVDKWDHIIKAKVIGRPIE